MKDECIFQHTRRLAPSLFSEIRKKGGIWQGVLCRNMLYKERHNVGYKQSKHNYELQSLRRGKGQHIDLVQKPGAKEGQGSFEDNKIF